MFLPQETGVLKKHLNRIAKATAKLKNIYILNFYLEYFLYLQSNTCGSFCQTCINLVEQQLKIFDFEGRHNSLI